MSVIKAAACLVLLLEQDQTFKKVPQGLQNKTRRRPSRPPVWDQNHTPCAATHLDVPAVWDTEGDEVGEVLEERDPQPVGVHQQALGLGHQGHEQQGEQVRQQQEDEHARGQAHPWGAGGVFGHVGGPCRAGGPGRVEGD